jgi:hypothetical protein
MSLITITPVATKFTRNDLNITTADRANNFKKGTYIASSSSYSSENTLAYNAFNGTTNTWWECGNTNPSSKPVYVQNPYTNSTPASYVGGGVPSTTYSTKVGNTTVDGEWLQIQIPYKIFIDSYSILPRQDMLSNSFPRKFCLVGSNDGNKWEMIDQQINPKPLDDVTKPTSFSITTIYSYSYFRLIISELTKGNRVCICQLNLNGYLNLISNNVYLNKGFVHSTGGVVYYSGGDNSTLYSNGSTINSSGQDVYSSYGTFNSVKTNNIYSENGTVNANNSTITSSSAPVTANNSNINTSNGNYTTQGGTITTTGGTFTTTGGTLNTTNGTIASNVGSINATGSTISSNVGTVNSTGGIVNSTGGIVNSTGGSINNILSEDAKREADRIAAAAAKQAADKKAQEEARIAQEAAKKAQEAARKAEADRNAEAVRRAQEAARKAQEDARKAEAARKSAENARQIKAMMCRRFPFYCGNGFTTMSEINEMNEINKSEIYIKPQVKPFSSMSSTYDNFTITENFEQNVFVPTAVLKKTYVDTKTPQYIDAIKEYQLKPLNNLIKQNSDITGNINIAHQQLNQTINPYLNERNKLLRDNNSDYNGNSPLYTEKKPTLADGLQEDLNIMIIKENNLYILGTITLATLLIGIIVVARN